ncbi:MAG: hypothetical protein DMF08_01235 [Verrucomicrobia bacterium]|nr:MAG: hypothetical protein DMF08_01235 [Verrucomicrobiota bacterium]
MPDELASVAFSLREQILKSFIRFGDRFVADLTKCRVELRFFPRSLAGGFPGRLPAFGLPTEGMIVSLVDVVLHLGSQRWSDFTTAGFTSQMRSISVELSFQIPEDRTTRGEFLIGDGLLKFCVAFVHLRVERSGSEFFARHSKLVDKGEFKIAQAFDHGIAPVLVNVAVPQLVMKITSAQRKTFRETTSDSYGVRLSGRSCADLDQRVKT